MHCHQETTTSYPNPHNCVSMAPHMLLAGVSVKGVIIDANERCCAASI
jgi:hypothetical protein